ncbi:hypothetical protein [Lentilactobacillus diolivorans]|nr:hypothetical protein [Lentilactobacillus diolivorans]
MKKTFLWAIHVNLLILTIFFLGWLITASWTSYLRFGHPSETYFFWGIYITIFIGVLIWILTRRLSNHYAGWLALVLLVLTIPKILGIFYFKLIPASDMWTYETLANLNATGASWPTLYAKGMLDLDSLWPQVLHIATTFGLIYRLFHVHLVVLQLLNIAATFLDALLLYYVIKPFGGSRVGIAAALIFYLTPAFYIYSVLIGAEPLWLLAVLLSFKFFNDLLLPRLRIGRLRYLMTIVGITGFLYLAQLLRPIIMIIVIAMILYGLFSFGQSESAQAWSRKQRLLSLLIIAISFITLTQFSTKIDQAIYRVPISNSIVGMKYTVATGSNSATKGQYDHNMILKLEKINHSQISAPNKFNQMDAYLAKKIKHNLATVIKNSNLPKFIFTKSQILLQSGYGFRLFWIDTHPVTHNHIPSHIKSISNSISAASQIGIQGLAFTVAILDLIYMCYYGSKSKRIHFRTLNGLFFMEILLIGLFIASLLVEVQDRYQVALYIPIIGIISNGISLLNQPVTDLPKLALLTNFEQPHKIISQRKALSNLKREQPSKTK